MERRWPVGAERQRQDDVDAPGDKAFEHGDLHRVAGGDFLREVVVDRPARTGARYEKRTGEPAPRHAPLPREDDASRDDREHPERDAAVHVLPEHEPRKERGEYSFEVEQE